MHRNKWIKAASTQYWCCSKCVYKRLWTYKKIPLRFHPPHLQNILIGFCLHICTLFRSTNSGKSLQTDVKDVLKTDLKKANMEDNMGEWWKEWLRIVNILWLEQSEHHKLVNSKFLICLCYPLFPQQRTTVFGSQLQERFQNTININTRIRNN